MPGSPRLQSVIDPFDADTGIASSYIDVAVEYASTEAGLTSALAAAATGTRRRVYLRGGTWTLTAKITIPVATQTIHLFGDPHDYDGTDGTVLVAGAAMTSVLEILSSYHVISDLKIKCERLATYGIFIRGWSLGKMERVEVFDALLDGVFLDNTATKFNDSNVIEQCIFSTCGTLYRTAGIAADYTGGWRATVTGTAATTAGNPTITITAGTDLTTLSPAPRKGDLVRVGNTMATAYYGQIESITATTVVVQGAARHLPTASVSGVGYAIGVGDGWHETQFSDNNLNTFINCVFRGNAASGSRHNGLYGPTATGCQWDYNNTAGISIGENDNSGLVRSATFTHPYVEANPVHFVFGQISDCTVISPNDDSGGIFSIGRGTAGATGVIIRNGYVEDLVLGAPQNLLVEVRNNAGTLQHRIVADHWDGNATVSASRVTGASVTWTDTPSVAAGTPFATGVGILAAFPNALLLHTEDQALNIDGSASVEFNSTGVAYIASITTDANNVNGVTHDRPAIYISSPTAGTLFDWDTTNIPVGTSVGIRVRLKMR